MKKKIIIFTCVGGHTVISEALRIHLESEYTIVVKNIFTDILWSIDPLKILTCGFFSAEDGYSFCIRNRLYSFMNKTYDHFVRYADLRKKRVRTIIKNNIVNEHPDLMISVIPFFNPYFLSVAEELNIPFILMPTDIEIKTFLRKMDKPITYKQFHFAIAIDAPEIREQLVPLQLPENQVHITGVALKEAFFKQHNIEQLKQRFSIPSHKPVILLLMGSQGSSTIQDFMKELAKITNVPFHLIVVLGHNTKQYKKLAKITFDPLVSTTFFGFTNLIPELMAISSLLITKSGGISMAEALYMNLPALFDATSEILIWEQLNQTFMQRNRFGTSVYHIEELSQMVNAFLTHQHTILDYYKTNMEAFPKKNGCEQIAQLLKKIL